MKRILLLILPLLCFTLIAEAQYTTPRPPVDNANATRQNITRLTQTLTDGAGKDSVFISPNAHYNYYSINPGDTMKGSLYIGLDNVTRNGVTYSKAGLYKYDKVIFDYRTSGLLVDTLFFNTTMFVCDSAGSGSASTIIIPKELTKKNYFLEFTFDGAKLVQSTLYK